MEQRFVITEQASQLALSCSALETGMRDEQEGAAVNRALTRLRVVAERVRSSRAVAAALPSVVPLEPEAKRRASLVRIRKALAEDDPATLVKSKKFETAIVNAEALGKNAAAAVNTEWRLHLTTLLPADLDEETTFPELPGVDKAIASLAAANARLQLASRLDPLEVLEREGHSPAEQLEEIQKNLDKREAALAALAEATAQFPPVVRAFIDAAGTDSGAPLDFLTEDLLTWLKANGQMDLYRVWPSGH